MESLDRLLDECLPPFCADYFMSIESRTSPLTRLNYAHDLKIFFYFLCQRKFSGRDVKDLTLEDMESVTSTDVEYFLSFLSRYKYDGKLHMCNDKAKARKLSAVKAMFKYFFKKDLISVNNTTKVDTPKIHEKPIIRLEDNEIPDMISTAESGSGLSQHQMAYHEHNKVRDTAILTLFLGTGIRISELVGLNNGDINFDNNSFVVTRKGGSKAILYFDDTVADALKKYLDQKEAQGLPMLDTSPLFLTTGTNRGPGRIGVRAVENMVKKYAKIVSPLKKITPHKLRSTYGTALYKATGDIYVVADVLGHKDINTTKKHYAAITDDARRSVVGKVKLKPDENQQ
ncbi:MAG: tyrosine-type recombinase/integrase [Clostridia bacterium]|nr:tyrosine-type recombinase/integrase [Clostridia bacterium]